MTLRAVTFDFHNTIARCDDWFALEVRDLVPAVLTWYGQKTGTPFESGVLDHASERYRALRRDIIHHGDELDAHDCTMQVLGDLELVIEPEMVHEGVCHVMRTALPGSMPVPGVVDSVRELADHGIRLGVVSSAVYHPFLEWSLEKFGILGCFETIITSASCGYYKSRTEIYSHALETLGVESTEAIHVGDSYRYDVQTPRQLGFRTVWYQPEPGSGNNEFNEADLTVTTLQGVSGAILSRFADAP